MKEFIPRKNIDFKYQGNDTSSITELKLACVKGAVQYVNSSKMGYTNVSLEYCMPMIPYSVTGYTHENQEKMLIYSLDQEQRYGFLSRNKSISHLELFLKDSSDRLQHRYIYKNDYREYRPVVYEEIAEMLENIKNYPRNLVHLLYQKYSDGILCGTGIQIVEDTTIVVEPGLLKHNGIIYYHTTKEHIPCEPLGIEQILVVHFEEQADNINDITYTTQFLLKKDGKVEGNEMELCRFILKEGAVLRKDYQDLRDMATLHNTVNIILTPFAGIGSATLSPEITYCFGQEMMKFKLTDAFDVSFVMHCMQQETIQKEVIEQYVRCRVPNAERGSLSQKQLHHYLTVIVDDTKRGGNRGGMMPGGTRRMLVN